MKVKRYMPLKKNFPQSYREYLKKQHDKGEYLDYPLSNPGKNPAIFDNRCKK